MQTSRVSCWYICMHSMKLSPQNLYFSLQFVDVSPSKFLTIMGCVIKCIFTSPIYTHIITLHVQTGFGLASHLGVLCGIPSVGIGKNLYYVDGLEKGPLHKEKAST